MNNRLLLTMIGCFICAIGWTQPVGEGTSTKPYQIGTAQELLWFAQLVNGTLGGVNQNRQACAELTADIDLSSVCGSSKSSWPGIGYNDDNAFNGTFHGNGHKIAHLYVNMPNEKRNGLFGTTEGATIEDIILTDGSITGNRRCAALVGSALSSSIAGITVKNFSINGENSTGSIVGGAEGSSLEDCHVENVEITAMTYVGGVCGYMSGTTVSGCSSTASITSPKTNIGGLVGKMEEKSSVSFCTASGSVSGTQYVGGLIGYSANSDIAYSAATGELVKTTISNAYTGGLAGYISRGNIQGCYAIIHHIETATSATSIGKFCGYCSADILSSCYSNETSLTQGGTERAYDVYKMEGMGTATGLNDEDFTSGKAAYLLNGNRAGQTMWRQNLGTDPYPVLEDTHYIVFASGSVRCDGSATASTTFTNNSSAQVTPSSHDASFLTEGSCHVCSQMNTQYLGIDSKGRYKIASADELLWFAKLVNSGANKSASAVLVADIDLSSKEWTPIGNYTTLNSVYSGTFDGNGHSIKGLSVNTSSSYIGLFGYTEGATILDVTLSGASVKAASYAGLLVGAASGTTIKNITIDATSTLQGTTCVGGVTGYLYTASTIENCHNEATITCTSQKVGGIAGYVNGSNIKIDLCVNKGTIIAKKYTNSGGIAGCLGSLKQEGIVIARCINQASIQAQGGIVGSTQCLLMGVNGASIDQNLHIIENCANLGNIEGATNNMGGIIGLADYTNIFHSYSQAALTNHTQGGYTGGVAGNMTSTANVINCHYDKTMYNGSLAGLSKGSIDLLSTSHPTEKFTNGEVCYLLNGSTSEGDLIWFQTIGTDNSPLFDGLIVFHDATQTPAYYNLSRGDVDGDGAVNISDVTTLVNIILGKATDTRKMADVDNDKSVTISDVTTLVNIILKK